MQFGPCRFFLSETGPPRWLWVFVFSLRRLGPERGRRCVIDSTERVKSGHGEAIQPSIATMSAEQAWRFSVALQQRGRALRFECLEDRRLLSIVPHVPAAGHAAPTYVLYGTATPNDTQSSTELVPEQVREAYGLDTYTSSTSDTVVNAISFKGVAGNGAGQTIAIVDAYDDPNAASDLSTFSSDYGLPQLNTAGGPFFIKLNQTGGTSLPGRTRPASSATATTATGRLKKRWTSSGHTPWRRWPTLFSLRRPITATRIYSRPRILPPTRRVWSSFP